jgi:Uma2 family endonuclease
MNQQLRSPAMPSTTQAAEGLPRRRWTVAEIEEMTRIGVFLEDDRFELIGGEIVPMNAKGVRHELLKAALNLYWAVRLPKDITFVPETTFRVSDDTFFEPDFIFYRKSDGLAGLNPRTALLAVEVSDSSLGYDLMRKTRLFASHGVPEVWVIDAVKLETHCHSGVGIDGYSKIAVRGPGEQLVPGFAPELAVALGALELV